MEVSLVSIPANTDAVITAFSQGKLHTPLVKSWARKYYDDRPVQVPVNIELKVNGQPLHMKADPEPEEKQAVPAESTPTESKQPSDTPPLDSAESNSGQTGDVAAEPAADNMFQKMLYGAMDDELRGSFEWIQDKLRDSAESYLAMSGKDVGDGYCRLIATFADQAIVCKRSYSYESKAEPKCYRIAWAFDDDGMPKFNGEPVDVEITAEVREKHVEVPHAKDHPTLEEMRTRFCRELVAMDTGKAVKELLPFVQLSEFYADQKESHEWDEFATSLVDT